MQRQKEIPMNHYICVTCGTQFAATDEPPAQCPICADERQYIGHQGQQWTTMAALQRDYVNAVKPMESNLIGIGMQPRFAIGQRALLVQSPSGNVLWDCVSLIDQPTVAAIRDLGGIAAIAISHPHYYSSMIEWSHAFDAPIYLHEAEREWIMRPDPAVEFWSGETKPLWDDLTLIRCGGHFEGGQVLHWPAGAGGRGALLTGDIIQVVADRRWVTFMYSYPNMIPLSPAQVNHIVAAVEPFAFDRIYGAWWDTIVAEDAKAAVTRSADRYICAVQGTR
jgi:hypothetical protein